MTINEAISEKPRSCMIDTAHKSEREIWTSFHPSDKISINENNHLGHYPCGMQIIIWCRHEGTKEDMIAAFKEAQQVLEKAIFEQQ